MPSLSPTRHYSIQNMDFESCLEMSVRPINKPVSSRPWKDSDKQRWKFVLVPGSEDEYCIYNEAQKTYLGFLSETDRRLVSKSRGSASKWLLYPVTSARASNVFEIVLAGEETETCLQLGEFGHAYIADRDDSEAQQWRIFSGPPSSPNPKHPAALEAGYYRIRNLDGHSILSLASPDSVDGEPEQVRACVAEQDSDNDHQRFFVKPREGDGQQFTIQSGAVQGPFLGVEGTQLVKLGTVRGLPHEFFWEIESIGGFAYTMSIRSVQGSLSLGFAFGAVKEDSWSQVVLLPSNSNHSQTWLFERWDKLPEGDSSSSTLSNSSASSLGSYRRIFDTNGWYNICSGNNTNYYLHLNGAYGAPHTYPCDVSYFKTYGSFYFVKRGRYFVIRDRYSTPYYAIAGATDTYLTATQNSSDASLWYIKQDKDRKDAFRLCLYEPARKKADGVRVLENMGVSTYGSAYYNIPLNPFNATATNQLWTIQ